MNFTLLRLEAMDAQRFDVSKRRKPEDLSITLVPPTPSVHCEESGVPQLPILSFGPSPFDETWTADRFSSATDDSTPASPTVIEVTIFTHNTDIHSADIFEKDGYTTTRTIIRPTSPRSPFLSIFSKPSSPTAGTVSRPGSPLCTRLTNLNCLCSTDAFEEELDFILQQRENDLAGVSQEIKVKVTQDQTVFYGDKLRDAVQAILHEPTPPIVSCVGHIHSF